MSVLLLLLTPHPTTAILGQNIIQIIKPPRHALHANQQSALTVWHLKGVVISTIMKKRADNTQSIIIHHAATRLLASHMLPSAYACVNT